MTGESSVLNSYYSSAKAGEQGHAGHLAVDPAPEVIVGNVSIFHPQLRDLLQPAGEKGKVLFVDRLNVACADFNTRRAPTSGEQSELDIRPLITPKEEAIASGSGRSNLSGAGSSGTVRGRRPAPPFGILDREEDSSQRNAERGSQPATNDAGPSRPTLHWHLRTPTGGSINNSIFIQRDSDHGKGKELSGTGKHQTRSHASASDPSDDNRYRGKRRKEEGSPTYIPARHARAQSDTPDRCQGRDSGSETAMTDYHGRIGWQRGRDGAIDYPYVDTRNTADRVKTQSVRLLVSNNDQTVRLLKLRPPTCPRRRNAGAGQAEEGLEAGMPGLSRTQTTSLPTSINHTSFSPDGKHAVSVGDTPDVFLFRVDQISGELVKIATYTASSDASFSTAWSPDGLHFAVASQDGIISVWDIRSQSKIAEMQTTRRASHFRSEAARVVKWSPRGDLLAFSEDSTFVHIVETLEYSVVQTIAVPSAAQVRQSGVGNAAGAASSSTVQCVRDPSPRRGASAELDDITMALWGSDGSVHEPPAVSTGPFAHGSGEGGQTATTGEAPSADFNWLERTLESTSPARFASGARTNATTSSATMLRPWMHGRRYRDIGGPLSRTAMMERALLGDWGGARHGTRDAAAAERRAVPARRILPSQQATNATVSPSHAASATEDAARSAGGRDPSVEALLADLTEATQRSAAAWGLSSSSLTSALGRRLGGYAASDTEISGLTWEPDGEFLYISTEQLILRYKVRNLFMQSGSAVMR